jgi:ElaB/YqjD/DUF883 family membrane-anchored ribosome-binding protein
MTRQNATSARDYPTSDASVSKDRLQDLASDTTDQLGKVTESAQELAGKLAEQAQEAVRNFKPYVEKSMKEQPMATLAVAAAIAFVLAAAWRK